MKIVYVENVRVPSERAHAYQIVQFCCGMARLGHEVMLVNPDRAQTAQDVFKYFGVEPGFTHVRLPVWDTLRYGWLPRSFAYLLQRGSFLRALKRWARGRQADVWYSRDPAMLSALSLVIDSGKLVLEAHDDPASNLRRWSNIRPRLSLAVAISQGMKDCLVRRGVKAEQILVAHDGFDPAMVAAAEVGGWKEKLGLPPAATLCVYAGSLYPWKGADFLVEAWSHTSPWAHLIIVGGPSGDRMRIERLTQAQARERVHVLPNMDRWSVFSLLQETDIALLPTSPDFSIGKHFTSPLKLFEYLAMGLPILASDVPSSHEILDETVARFYPPQAETFAMKLGEMIEDVSWRAQAAERARELVAGYTWQARAERISQVLTRLVDQ